MLVPAEVWSNKNTFTGRPIVPEHKERLDPELQYGHHTSLSARELGRAINVMPANLDHLVRGFFGTMGVYSVMLSDQGVRATGDYPDCPEKTWRQMPVIGHSFMTRQIRTAVSINEFYELLGKARRADATHKRLPDEQAEAYFESAARYSGRRTGQRAGA